MNRSSPPLLTGLCCVTIARRLDQRVVVPFLPTPYEPHHYNPQEVNPFSCFPPGIVEELVNAVYKITADTRMNRYKRWRISLVLRPLLLSGRIENLTVHIRDLDFEDSPNILTIMLSNADKLKSLRLKTDSMLDSTGYQAVANKFNLLLAAAVNLERLYTDLVFDYRKLEKLGKLHTIKFTKISTSKSSIFRFVINGDIQGRISKDGTAFLLQKLPRLRCVNTDVAKALELIHRKIRWFSQISNTYELRKACLHAPTKKQVCLFVRTCPHVKRLTLLLDKLKRMEVYKPLVKMENIVHVTIKFVVEICNYSVHEPGDSYTVLRITETKPMSALISLLSCLKGDRLTSLKLKFYITDLDVQSLSSLCPNLQVLQLRFRSDVQPSKPLHTCFPRLKQLQVIFEEFSSICTDNWLLLTSSPALLSLYLANADYLTDEAIIDILERNPMSCLESLFLDECSLTHHGLLKVIRQCSNLREIKYISEANDFPTEELTEMAQDINPHLRITF